MAEAAGGFLVQRGTITLRAESRHFAAQLLCLLFPQKRTFAVH
jgi:hypothetical protein